jgi:dUTPase
MLANHTGIIDSGYRGSLIAAVRYLPESQYIVMEQNDEDFENNTENVILRKHVSSYTLEKDTRLFQICHPSLLPIYVEVLDENELSETIRGEGGFGSTGK